MPKKTSLAKKVPQTFHSNEFIFYISKKNSILRQIGELLKGGAAGFSSKWPDIFNWHWFLSKAKWPGFFFASEISFCHCISFTTCLFRHTVSSSVLSPLLLPQQNQYSNLFALIVHFIHTYRVSQKRRPINE